ncbi:hypothetical protein [Bdellovibrio sp. HCB2-146]|uniref:hypothetical protein n=1 Tax=Bdellovibrio sp. HCB2-146 TaxID=3394362 RepID=UPI0039BC29FE
MKELKLNRAIKCLYVVALVQVLTTAYSAFISVRALREIENMGPVPGFDSSKYTLWSALGTGSIWALIVIVGAYYVTQDLKKGKWWAWVGALSISLLTAPSWSFPASVIGIISLLDEEVRGEFLAQLDVKI